jgi:uncharacterized membrane protein
MSKNLAWASLICGILAFVLAPLGPILATAAIICGFLGRARKKYRTIAMIGLILGVVFWILFTLAIITGAMKDLLGIIGL